MFSKWRAGFFFQMESTVLWSFLLDKLKCGQFFCSITPILNIWGVQHWVSSLLSFGTSCARIISMTQKYLVMKQFFPKETYDCIQRESPQWATAHLLSVHRLFVIFVSSDVLTRNGLQALKHMAWLWIGYEATKAWSAAIYDGWRNPGFHWSTHMLVRSHIFLNWFAHGSASFWLFQLFEVYCYLPTLVAVRLQTAPTRPNFVDSSMLHNSHFSFFLHLRLGSNPMRCGADG